MTSKILKSDSKTLDRIVSALKYGKTFCLIGHKNPDPDVVGSQLALRRLILELGKDKAVKICNWGPAPTSLAFLENFDLVNNMQKVSGQYDVLVVFESSGMERTGNIIDMKTQAKEIINIDHHLNNPEFGTINWVEPWTSSTAEMIFKIYEHAKVSLDSPSASAIYMGLIADTGCFRYGNTNAQTHRIGAKLIEAGVNVGDLSERLYMSRSKEFVRIQAYVLTTLKYEHGQKVAILTISEKFMREIGATDEDLEEIVNLGLLNRETHISIFLRERESPRGVKVSLRSKGATDINKVARTFGGGGHKNASGCFIAGQMEMAEKKILSEIEKVL